MNSCKEKVFNNLTFIILFIQYMVVQSNRNSCQIDTCPWRLQLMNKHFESNENVITLTRNKYEQISRYEHCFMSCRFRKRVSFNVFQSDCIVMYVYSVMQSDGNSWKIDAFQEAISPDLMITT